MPYSSGGNNAASTIVRINPSPRDTQRSNKSHDVAENTLFCFGLWAKCKIPYRMILSALIGATNNTGFVERGIDTSLA